MFIDSASLSVRAGKGGNGALSFRHEKYVDKGGPDGGDGGKGGDVIFVARENLNTLAKFRYQPKLAAENGGAGDKRNKHGKNGANLLVDVPRGTIVRDQDSDEILADLTEDGEQSVIVRGGAGGYGNAHFKSSVRQAPRVAELGEKGEEKNLALELKMLADVGLAGLPNAGKSTFLAAVSDARPKIANYAFTTLSPQLGVADIDDDRILFADIPGLIEGASDGKGLGTQFLRHVERTAVILHLLDATSNEIAQDYQKIRHELKKYSKNLAQKPEIIALSKIDLVDQEIIEFQKAELAKVTKNRIFAISSVKKIALKEILREISRIVKKERAKNLNDSSKNSTENIVIKLSDQEISDAWQVEKMQGGNSAKFVVRGAKIEKFARRTDFSSPHGLNRLREIMRKMGIAHELIRLGAQHDSEIKIAEKSFKFFEEK